MPEREERRVQKLIDRLRRLLRDPGTSEEDLAQLTGAAMGDPDSADGAEQSASDQPEATPI